MVNPLVPPTDGELRSVLEPEFNSTTFVFGKHADGQPRIWNMQPLPWKYERNFRRQVLPLLAASYKPFEMMIGVVSQDFLSGVTPSIVQGMFEAEIAEDEFLVKAMHAVLIAQDKNVTEQWVDENALSREQLFALVQQQCDLHKVMDRLGESLAGRFAKLAHMMNLDLDLPTLKRLWKQVSETLSARIMQASSIAGSAIGLSTASMSEPMLPRQTNGAPPLPAEE